MSKQLLEIDRPTFTVSILPEGNQLKAKALEVAKGIVTIINDDDLERAGIAAQIVQGFRGDVEKMRKALTAPVNELKKKIDDSAKGLAMEVEAEYNRITQLIAKYQGDKLRAEQEKLAIARREAEAAQRELERLQALKKPNKAAVAAAELATMEAQASVQPIQAPTKVSGVTLKTEWDFEVTDIKALLAARPDLVELSVKRAEIKAAIVGGQQIPGLKVFENTSVSARGISSKIALQ